MDPVQLIEKAINNKRFKNYKAIIEAIEENYTGDHYGLQFSRVVRMDKEEHYPSLPLIHWAESVVRVKVTSYDFSPVLIGFQPPTSDILQELLNRIAKREDYQDVVEKLSRAIFLYQLAGLYTYKDGGRYCFQVILPTQLIIDPDCNSVEQAKYFGFYEVCSPEQVNYEYGVTVDKPTEVYHLYAVTYPSESEGAKSLRHYIVIEQKVVKEEETQNPDFVVVSHSRSLLTPFSNPNIYYLDQLNQAVDRSLKYLLDNAYRTSHNATLVRKSAVVNPEAVVENRPGGIILVDIVDDLQTAVLPVNAQPLADAHQRNIDTILRLTDLFFSISEHLKTQVLGSDTSGRAIEQLTASSYLEAQALAKKVAKALACGFRYVVQDAVKIVDPDSFQVVVGKNFTFPSLPHDRIALMLAVVNQLAQLPAPLAKIVLDSSDFPEKDKVVEILTALQAQPNALQAQPSVPVDTGQVIGQQYT